MLNKAEDQSHVRFPWRDLDQSYRLNRIDGSCQPLRLKVRRTLLSSLMFPAIPRSRPTPVSLSRIPDRTDPVRDDYWFTNFAKSFARSRIYQGLPRVYVQSSVIHAEV